MNQFQCGHCGYDMTGIERVSNGLDMAMFAQFSSVAPMGMGGFYNHTLSNSVQCPNCGTVGHWLKG